MAGSHLERTGYCHAVMAIATIAALVSAMWTSSSFVGPISNHYLAETPIIEGAYNAAHRYATAMIALQSFGAFTIVIMSLFIDWHINAIIPAYVEYTWVGLVWCLQLVAVIIAAGPGSAVIVCNPKALVSSEQSSGINVCSNWKAILVTAVIALLALTFHLLWHFIFRLWHRATLANRPTAPIYIWETPLPRNYPTNPREKQAQVEDNMFVALNESGTPPADSNAPDPYSLIFAPVSVQKAQRSIQQAEREHVTQIVSTRASTDDLEKSVSPDNVSIASSKACSMIPPGLDVVTETRKSYPTEN